MAKPISVGASAPALGIAAHIAVIDGQPTTTTRDIAEVFGKRHDDVLRIVRQRMEEAGGEWRLRNFTEASIEVPNTNGGTVSYPVIRMTEKGFMFVVQKFTGKKAVHTQIAYVDEFERMRGALRRAAQQPASIDPHALMLAGQSEPVALTREHQALVNRHAWMLAHEAYELARQHIERRVACRTSPAARLEPSGARVRQIIESVTLGNALAHTHLEQMRVLQATARTFKDAADAAFAQMSQASQEGGAA